MPTHASLKQAVDRHALDKHAPERRHPRSHEARAGPPAGRPALARSLLAFAAVAGTALAFAAPQTRPQEEAEATPPQASRDETTSMPAGFAELDLNGDGQLTREEAAADAALVLRFDDADLDDDDLLTPAEHASIDDEPPMP